MKFIQKCLKGAQTHLYLILFLVSFLICWVHGNGLWSQLMQMQDYKSEFYKRQHPQSIAPYSTLSESQKNSGLVYDLITMDLQNGVTGEELAQQARRNVSLYLDDVSGRCHTDHTDRQNENFVACAGRLVSEHFYYSPGGPVAANYAHNNSDCDASTYLMLTAAANAGLQAWIVYAPSHAFFAWQDTYGNYHYWETTDKNNRGKWADFSEELYDKTMSKAYYTPHDSRYAKQLYQAIIYTDSDNRTSLDSGLIPLSDNDFVSDNLLYEKAKSGRLTESDVIHLRSGLQEDFTSTDRIKALGMYYIDQGDKEKAYSYLSRITPENCQTSCINLLAKTRFYYRAIAPFYMFFDTIFDSTDAFYSLSVFYLIVETLVLALFTVFIGYIYFSPYVRTMPQKKMLEDKKVT